MLQANITAKSALLAQQERMDILSNNIANVDTIGFRTVRADFKDMMYQTMTRPVQPQEDLNMEKGYGTLLGATTRSFNKGVQQMTGEPLDMMLDGDGFFVVLQQDGQLRYTLAGNFYLSVEGTTSFLVDANGNYVLNNQGQRIDLQGGKVSTFAVDTAGNMTIDKYNETTGEMETLVLGKLGVARFMNRMGLEADGDNLFRASANSGEAHWDTTTKVIQGYIEGSNVDMATEMTTLIRAQKAFAFASRALSTADEMDGMANQLRR